MRRDVPRAAGRVAGSRTSRGCRSARSAACSIQRDAAARRRVPVPGQAVPHEPRRRCAGSSTRTSSRSRVDGERVHLASFGGDKDDSRRRARTRRRRATTSTARFTVRVPLKAGPHDDHRGVPREDARAQHAPPAAVRPQLDRHARLLGLSAHRQFTLTGPFNPTGAGRHAEPPPRSSCAGRRRAADEDAVRATHPLDAGAPRVPRRRDRRRPATRCSSSSARGREDGGTLRRRASSWRCSACSPARSSCSASSAIRPASRRARVYRAQRSRAGVAAVVLPVEQHSRRRAARRWRARGRLQTPAVLEQQVRRMLADPKVAGARRQLRRPVAVPAQPEEQAAELARVPRLRRQPAPGVADARPSCSSRASCARTATSLDLMTADYTFVNERLAQALRHPERLRQPVPPRRR